MAGLTRGAVGGAFATMLFRSRQHFDVPVCSKAHDQRPRVPDSKKSTDQGYGYTGSFRHANTRFHVSHIHY
jgi:hypothetical protein